MASPLLMRIPLLRRPFHQRDVARRERDDALGMLARAAQRPLAPTPRRDMAEWFGYEQFHWHTAQDVDQDQSIGDFRDLIRRAVARNRPSVEVGPSLNPIIAKRDGYAVTVVDHADAPHIAAKYAAQGLDTSRIEPVDVVWQGGRLSDSIKRRDTAAIVASHMIEHATDFVGFLDDCTELLADDGQILLIVPDRRYCFDFMHPTSDVAKVIDDHRQRHRVHPFTSVYRNCTNIAANMGGRDAISWGPHPIDDIRFVHGNPLDVFDHVPDPDNYVDSHANYFTPSSFVLLIEELRYLGLLRLMPKIVTRTRGCEFLVTLAKAPDRPNPPLAEYLDRKKFLVLNMLREERERLDHLGKLLDA